MDEMTSVSQTPEEDQNPKGMAWELYSWLREIVICIAIITTVFVFFVRLVSVSGWSMFPTLNDGDKVALISNFISQDYDQGDIVVLLQERFKNEPLIKRVIATAGQDSDHVSGFAAGDQEARNALIEHNLRLVAHIAKKYRHGRDIDDLISIGSIGLIKAVNTFSPSRGKSLAAYAGRCIENEILMALRQERKRTGEVRSMVAAGAPVIFVLL